MEFTLLQLFHAFDALKHNLSIPTAFWLGFYCGTIWIEEIMIVGALRSSMMPVRHFP